MHRVEERRSSWADRTRVMSRDARDLVPVTRGLGALYRSDDGVTLNALAASAWRDVGTGAGDLAQGTGANQPTVVPGAVGARTALRLDGSNDQLSRAITTGTSPSARGLSAVFVAQGRTGSSGDFPQLMGARPWTAVADAGWAVCANGSGGAGVVSAHFADGTTGFDHNDVASQATVGLSTTRRELWCVVFDDVANRLRFYRNGQLNVERSPTFPSTQSIPAVDFRIGADRAVGVGSRFVAMDLFAAAIHTEPLTPGEVQTYWSRWGPLYGVLP